MKTIVSFLSLGLVLGALNASAAQDDQPLPQCPAWKQGPGHGPRRAMGTKPQRRQQMLERFDADGDGKLSDEERATARETLKAEAQERRDEHFARMDANGDGLISKEEFDADFEKRQQERQKRCEEIKARFDADGDGKLSAEERAAAREAMCQRRQECPAPCGPQEECPLVNDEE